ncbi:MAG: Gfo/Idh/MocA family oxidoreductase [Planctomycetes bacterium]|nr:Gfo/Idh/MocA family oxidoreductase [Planctomycetota bacterium]
MSGALRLAVVGAGGRIAQDYLTVLPDSADLAVVAFVEADATARARLSGPQRGGDRPPGSTRPPPVFDSVDALLLDGPEFDVALLLTPPATHEPLTIELLHAGRHVLCEKPLATDVAAARRMLDAARAADRLLVMASKFRFVADVDRARELLDAGAVGTPLLYENVFCAPVPMAGRWNADPAVSGGGVLIDNGAHAADLARCLGGEVVAITAAAAAPRVQDVAVEDTARVTIETASGAVGHVDLSWSLSTGRPDYATVHGTAGSLSLCWSGLRLRDARGAVRDLGDGYDKRRAFGAQLEQFARAVRGLEPPRPDATDALHSVAFVAAAYRAMRERRRIAIEEVLA